MAGNEKRRKVRGTTAALDTMHIVIGIVITLVISFRGKSAPVSVTVGEEGQAEGGSLPEDAEAGTEENGAVESEGDAPSTGDEI